MNMETIFKLREWRSPLIIPIKLLLLFLGISALQLS
nr:MAG TPA: hypothetical protein [Bacteriophage sp.]